MHDVAIDGPSGCGKTSVGVRVAQVLALTFVDSGLLYRVFTAAYRQLYPSDLQLDECHLAGILRNEIRYDAEGAVLFDGRRPAIPLHDPQVDAWVSPVSTVPEVRAAVNRELRKISMIQDVVMVGRDIGTTVLPSAFLKVFLTARADVRAMRRTEQLRQEGVLSDFQEVLSNILDRDRIDSSRADSPLHCTAEYLQLDNSADDMNVVVRAIVDEYRRRMH